MLAVTIEEWPGGNILQRRVIGTMNLANDSDLSLISNYVGILNGQAITVKKHYRTDGAWELVRKALEQNKHVI